MAQQLKVKYCSNPDGHAPKDCPDYPAGEDLLWYQKDKEDLQENLNNMDIELDDDELEEKIHDGTLLDLM